MGTKLAGATVQIRFRIGTDDAQGDVGWQLDNIALTGITNTPFASLVADTKPCGASSSTSSSSGGMGGAPSETSASSAGTGGSKPGQPVVIDGCGCEVAGGSTGAGMAAQLLALGALLVRRRRRLGPRTLGGAELASELPTWGSAPIPPSPIPPSPPSPRPRGGGSPFSDAL